MARNAVGATHPRFSGSRWLKALSGLVRPTPKKPERHSRLTYLLTLTRLEMAMAEVRKAKRQKRKAPFREVYSARHDLLRQELGRNG